MFDDCRFCCWPINSQSSARRWEPYVFHSPHILSSSHRICVIFFIAKQSQNLIFTGTLLGLGLPVFSPLHFTLFLVCSGIRLSVFFAGLFSFRFPRTFYLWGKKVCPFLPCFPLLVFFVWDLCFWGQSTEYSGIVCLFAPWNWETGYMLVENSVEMSLLICKKLSVELNDVELLADVPLTVWREHINLWQMMHIEFPSKEQVID